MSPYERRPAGAPSELLTKAAGPSLALTPVEADDFALAVDGAFVVVVRHPNGRMHRRVFLTIASAQRAARNAADRGQRSRVILSELKPLYDIARVGDS